MHGHMNVKYRHCVLLPESQHSRLWPLERSVFSSLMAWFSVQKNNFIREFKKAEKISKLVFGLIFKFVCTKAENSSTNREWTCLYENLSFNKSTEQDNSLSL